VKEKLKFWILINLITLIVVFPVMLFVSFFQDTRLEIFSIITEYRIFPYICICLWAFLCAFCVKVVKEDLPWYLYSTIGFIYVTIVFFSFPYLKELFQILGYYKYINLGAILSALQYSCSQVKLYFFPEIYKLLLYTFLASLLGGGIIDIYNYVKKPEYFK